MPKILRIINRFNIGGPTYNAAYLTKYLSSDFETLLVGGQKDITEDSSEFILDNLGLTPTIIPEMRREVDLREDRKAYNRIKEIIGDFKPDIVHTHASKAGAVGRLAAHKMQVPLIYHTFHGHVFHSYFGKAKTTLYKNVERNLARKSTRIIAISEIQKHELSAIHKICKPEKITVVPLGFDLERFHTDIDAKRSAFRKKWKIEESEIVVGIIGRLVPIKNHDLFLEAAKRVSERTHQKVKFMIVGDGELRSDLENKVITLGLNNVVFTSWQKNVDEVNAGLDIIALTSKNEGTPVSLIEAQAAGKPIVSTRVGGIENVVMPNQTALLSASEDVEGLAQNLLELIEDPVKRDAFSKKGGHVLEAFHYKRLCHDFEQLYINDLKLTL